MIIKCFKYQRHYLEGSYYLIRVQIDYANLTYFFTTKTLNIRQAQQAELLTAYNFIIKYKLGQLNPADILLRCQDYKLTRDKEIRASLLPMLQRKLILGLQLNQTSINNPSIYSMLVRVGSLESLFLRLLVIEATSPKATQNLLIAYLKDIIQEPQYRDAYI